MPVNLGLLNQEFLTICFLPINANYRFACKWSFHGIPSPEITIVHMLAATPSLFDESPYCYQLFSSQLFLSVCLGQRSLNVFVIRFCDFDGHVKRENACFYRCYKPFLTAFKQFRDHVNILSAHTNLGRNFAIVVTSAS